MAFALSAKSEFVLTPSYSMCILTNMMTARRYNVKLKHHQPGGYLHTRLFFLLLCPLCFMAIVSCRVEKIFIHYAHFYEVFVPIEHTHSEQHIHHPLMYKVYKSENQIILQPAQKLEK